MLDLEKPIDRTIAAELMRLASTRDGCEFERLVHHPPTNNASKAKMREIKLAPAEADGRGGDGDRAPEPPWSLILNDEMKAKGGTSSKKVNSCFAWLGLSPSDDYLMSVVSILNRRAAELSGITAAAEPEPEAEDEEGADDGADEGRRWWRHRGRGRAGRGGGGGGDRR